MACCREKLLPSAISGWQYPGSKCQLLRINSLSGERLNTAQRDIWRPHLQTPFFPEDVAAAVLWLASDAAGFVIGQNLCVDGGFLAG